MLFGEGMPRVTCFMDRANTFGDAEDYVKLILSGDGRPVIDIEISSCQAYPGPLYNLQGTRGGMKATMREAEWRYFKPAEAPKQKLIRTPLFTAEGTPAYAVETLRWHTGKWEGPLRIGPLRHHVGLLLSRPAPHARRRRAARNHPRAGPPPDRRHRGMQRQNPRIYGK